MSGRPVCARCGGCGDSDCWGCGARWCKATASGGGCDACMKPVLRPAWMFRRQATVHCVGNRHHSGPCTPGNQRTDVNGKSC